MTPTPTATSLRSTSHFQEQQLRIVQIRMAIGRPNVKLKSSTEEGADAEEKYGVESDAEHEDLEGG